MGESYKSKDRPNYRAITYQGRLTEELYLIMCGIENCLPGYSYSTDGRPGYHLHVVLKGHGTLCVDKKEEKLGPGKLFMTKPGEKTKYTADKEDPWVYCWMTFDGPRALEFVQRSGFMKGVNSLDCFVDPDSFLQLCKKVIDLPEVKPSNVMMRLGCMLEYIALAIESYYNSGLSERKKHEYPTEAYVEYAADFIRMNYATAKIGDVAKYIGIHRSYLTGIFKEKMGLSVQEYLIKCKLERASEFLINTDNPIHEIALQVGYDNPLTFSRSFKNYYGISPKFYREQHKENRELSQ